ncbi:MAG TPA: ADP-ribosylglycohydrolase family protein [Deinococcales bacterium]|nr:ADP-ribosylglycohydrolase family protein [Deinococcales bacterium]
MTLSFRDCYRGSLLGLAVGDALGTTLEFRRPGTFEPIAGMVGGGPFDLKAGEWTDDTSMMLCLAESLIERRELDPADQMRLYLEWYRNGHHSVKGYCFDIGGTVGGALRRYEQTGEPYSGSTDPHSAGNGSLMRLAPVPLRYAATPAEAVRLAGESSRTTHGAATAVDSCRLMSALIVAALVGKGKDEVLAAWQHGPLHPQVQAVADGSYRSKEPPAIKGTGFVVDSLEAALWAFSRARDYREGALLAVNLGDDADTTGAVYGQLAGAYWGESGIPPEWLERLAQRDVITAYADRLHDLAWKGAEE